VISTADSARNQIASLLSPDEAFCDDFAKHSESKGSRVQYFLTELEATLRASQGQFSRDDYKSLRSFSETVSPDFILPRAEVATDEEIAEFYRLGNRILIEDAIAVGHEDEPFLPEHRNLLEQSSLRLTKEIACDVNWSVESIHARGLRLAKLAVNTWTFSRTINF